MAEALRPTATAAELGPPAEVAGQGARTRIGNIEPTTWPSEGAEVAACAVRPQ